MRNYLDSPPSAAAVAQCSLLTAHRSLLIAHRSRDGQSAWLCATGVVKCRLHRPVCCGIGGAQSVVPLEGAGRFAWQAWRRAVGVLGFTDYWGARHRAPRRWRPRTQGRTLALIHGRRHLLPACRVGRVHRVARPLSHYRWIGAPASHKTITSQLPTLDTLSAHDPNLFRQVNSAVMLPHLPGETNDDLLDCADHPAHRLGWSGGGHGEALVG